MCCGSASARRSARNEWDPATGAIPPSVQEMLDYARSRNLSWSPTCIRCGLHAEPANGWSDAERQARATWASTSFQDWLIARARGFPATHRHQRLLVRPHVPRPTRREQVRAVVGLAAGDGDAAPRIPDIVIDGRQAYQIYGPWTWLAGSYPHPTSTDEQPESFVSFPGPEARPRLRRPRTLHRVPLSRLRIRAERDRARLYHPPDRAQ